MQASRYLCGDAMGLADAALMPFVRQYAATDQAWFDALPLPGLQAWLARLTASSMFVAAMLRLAPWKGGDAPILFSAAMVLLCALVLMLFHAAKRMPEEK